MDCRLSPLRLHRTTPNCSSAIIDARLGFKIIQGVTVIVGFAIEEEIKHWRKMMLPKEPALMQMIDGMKSERIGVNVEFIAPSK